MKRKVYQSETDEYIEMEIIGKVKYIGKSFGVESLTNGAIYDVVGIEKPLIRIIDDSEEDYLYSITEPAALEDNQLCGRWKVIEDYTEGNELSKIIK